MMSNKNRYDVLLVLESSHIKNRQIFESHLKKEGFLPIDDEPFAYVGKAELPLFNTQAYIFDVLKKAMQLSNSPTLSFVSQLDNNKPETYIFDSQNRTFTLLH